MRTRSSGVVTDRTPTFLSIASYADVTDAAKIAAALVVAAAIFLATRRSKSPFVLPGLLLATPLTVSIKVICRNVPYLHWLAALLDQRGANGDPPVAARVWSAVTPRVTRTP